MSVAVIGPPSFITAFELIGAKGYDASSGKIAAEILQKIIDEGKFNLILIPERFASNTLSLREDIMKKGEITPLFALIPDFTMETGMRMEELQAVVSLAIGTKLEL
ncbi:V-type ATP synthase subunit F [Candidatus Bathyarchaeota archaeon]|nr:V-type ATP synthase subunit F [Candidatus Bathyarchaeota archaeon]